MQRRREDGLGAWMLNKVLGRHLLTLVDEDFVEQNHFIQKKSPLEQMKKHRSRQSENLIPPLPHTFGLPRLEESHCSESQSTRAMKVLFWFFFFFLCFLSSDAHEVSVYLDLMSHQKHDSPSSPAAVLLNEACPVSSAGT